MAFGLGEKPANIPGVTHWWHTTRIRISADVCDEGARGPAGVRMGTCEDEPSLGRDKFSLTSTCSEN